MVKCSYCSEEELLPFTCRYCNRKVCKKHHLPESHDCKGISKEKVQAKKRSTKVVRSSLKHPTSRSGYKKAYEIPGVTEVVERRKPVSKSEGAGVGEGFELDEKLIIAGVLLLILILGIVSRLI